MNKNTIIFLILFICSNGFSYVGWDYVMGGRAQFLLLIFLFLLFLSTRIFNKLRQSTFKYEVLAFMLIPLFSIIPAFIVHGQGVFSTLYATKYNFFYCLFFLLYYWKVDDRQLLKLFFFLGVAWCIVEVIQQLSYPNVWFATRTQADERGLEVRNGIYRYNTCGREFGLIMLFYSFVEYLNKRKIVYLWGVLLGLIGVYLLATRQIIVAVIFCFLYALFFGKKIKMFYVFFFIFTAVFLIYTYADVLFGEMLENTIEDLDNDDYVRFLAYEYYGIDYNNGNIIQILLGNGDPGGETVYGNEIDYLQDEYGFWRADIGIVGLYSLYGIIYLLAIAAFYYHCYKKLAYMDLYLKMYLVYMLVTSIMLWHFGYSAERITIMSCITYLIDKSIKRNEILHNNTCI